MENRRFLLPWVVLVAWLTFNQLQVSLKSVSTKSHEFLDSPPSVDFNFADASLKPCIFNSTRNAVKSIQKRVGSSCPSGIPMFDRPRARNSTRQINLCLIGKTTNFSVVNNFIREHPAIPPEWIQFHCFGSSGPRTKVLYWTSHLHDEASYSEYLYDICDGMIGVPVEDSNLPSGMLHAMAYSRPLLLGLEDARVYENQIAPTTIFTGDSMSRSLERLIKFVEPHFFDRKPDCQVLIDNHQFDFHYFLLESFMALYPLPATPECNHNYLQFTFLIHRSGNPFQWNRAESWKRYALGPMSQKYRSHRMVKTVMWGTETSSVPTSGYHYIIKASCYCIEEDVAWLSDSKNTYCVFHEACDAFSSSPKALWLSPHHKQYALPTLLPVFAHPRPVNSTINFCIIGHPTRRNYHLVAHFLKLRNPDDVFFHNIGWGPKPKAMDGFDHLYARYDESDFVLFETMVYDLCDVILGLLTKNHTPDYFDGPKKKQSGSMLQAIAYQRPMVLHEDLAEPYKHHLTDIEVHNDDPDSFVGAMDRILDRLRKERQKIHVI